MLISQGPADNPEYRCCDNMEEFYRLDASVIFDRAKSPDSTVIYNNKNRAKSLDLPNFLERLRSSPISTFDDMEMDSWLHAGGFWGRDIVAHPSVKMIISTAATELTTDLSHLAVVREEIIGFSKEADMLNDDMLRAQSRRNIMFYLDIRVRQRVMTGHNDPVPYGTLKGMQALAVGGSWGGTMYEWAVARWPNLPREVCPFFDELSAFSNAVASFHRDAYDGSTNSLDGIYGMGSESISYDLHRIVSGILSSGDSLRIACLHMFCITNSGKRYAFWVDLAVLVRQPIHVDKSTFTQDIQDMFGATINVDSQAKIFQIYSGIIDAVSRAFDEFSSENAFLSPEPWKLHMRAVNSLFTTAMSNHLEDGYSAMATTAAALALLNAVANFTWGLPEASHPCRTVLAVSNGRYATIEP